MNCKNCNEETHGNFCAFCGQSTKVNKIDLRSFASDVSDTIIKVDKGLFFTLQQLFLRPGKSIRDYLDGKRVSYFKPIAFVFGLSTLYFLIAKVLGSSTFLDEFIVGYALAEGESEDPSNHLVILNWFASNYAVTALLLLPFFALSSFTAFFKSGFNYMEHLVVNAYITGQQTIFYSLAAVFSLVVDSHDMLESVTLFISISYTLFVYWQFFSEEKRSVLILRFVATYVLYILFIIIAIFLVFLVYR
jgi:hypothetical protein